jgi:pyruvate dehydrogenase (quinone)
MGTTAADVLVDCLTRWGVEIVFGLPGDGINGTMEAFVFDRVPDCCDAKS